MNGMPPLPGEGHVTQTIANYKAIEALAADIYVAGHGDPGTLSDVRAQRAQLEGHFQHAKECFEQGMSYDAALKALSDDGVLSDSRRMIVLCSYCEFTGRLPESADPASQNHLTLLRGIATEAKLLLVRRQ